MLSIFLFLAKLPLFTLHIWLPKAHVQAPTTGSMVLAGIILKLGGYGLVTLRKSINKAYSKLLTSIAVVSATTITVLRTRQTDKKTMIAYSSVRHIIILLANIVSLTP